MTTLERTLVYFGLWILGIYIGGLVFKDVLMEPMSKVLFYTLTLSFIWIRLLLNWPLRKPKINKNALFLFLVSLVLILPLALVSNHIIGVDSHSEYLSFMRTDLDNELYMPGGELVPACLSVTVLPTVIQDVTRLDSERLFNILYPLIFSVFPVIVYCLAKRFVGNKYAIVAGLLVMLQPIFLWTTANGRTSIGVLFLALCLLVLFSKLSSLEKFIYMSLLGVGCTLSHYATGGILLALLTVGLLSSNIRKPIIGSLVITTIGTFIWFWYTGLDPIIKSYLPLWF